MPRRPAAVGLLPSALEEDLAGLPFRAQVAWQPLSWDPAGGAHAVGDKPPSKHKPGPAMAAVLTNQRVLLVTGAPALLPHLSRASRGRASQHQACLTASRIAFPRACFPPARRAAAPPRRRVAVGPHASGAALPRHLAAVGRPRAARRARRQPRRAGALRPRCACCAHAAHAERASAGAPSAAPNELQLCVRSRAPRRAPAFGHAITTASVAWRRR